MKHYTIKVKQVMVKDYVVLIEIYDNNGKFLVISKPIQMLSDPYKLVTMCAKGYLWMRETYADEFHSFFGDAPIMYSMDIYI